MGHFLDHYVMMLIAMGRVLDVVYCNIKRCENKGSVKYPDSTKEEVKVGGAITRDQY